jgi:hypothetical protein
LSGEAKAKAKAKARSKSKSKVKGSPAQMLPTVPEP